MCYEGDIKRGSKKRSNGKLGVSQITFSLSTIRAGVGREEMWRPTKLISNLNHWHRFHFHFFIPLLSLLFLSFPFLFLLHFSSGPLSCIPALSLSFFVHWILLLHYCCFSFWVCFWWTWQVCVALYPWCPPQSKIVLVYSLSAQENLSREDTVDLPDSLLRHAWLSENYTGQTQNWRLSSAVPYFDSTISTNKCACTQIFRGDKDFKGKQVLKWYSKISAWQDW